MKFGLIGKDIAHSKSPELYIKIIGPKVIYDLIDIADEVNLPMLSVLAKTYQGINITSPYKKNYLKDVIIQDAALNKLGAINTIALSKSGFFATNTDLLAVRSILTNFKKKYSRLSIVLLGNGVMAKVTQLVAAELDLEVVQFSRTVQSDLSSLDLGLFAKASFQTLVINACSRDFQFKGNIPRDFIFWDYNYSFYPHQNTLPFKVKEYQDGQEMLFLQAKAAWDFWQRNIH